MQLDLLAPYKVRALLTSFSEIKLPSLLGGKVNPGLDNVNVLVDQLQPKYITNTHDEEKTHSGIVMKLAKVNYPQYSELAFNGVEVLEFGDYGFKEFWDKNWPQPLSYSVSTVALESS